MTPRETRVLLADDHELVREGLRMILDAQPDLEVVAEAGDGGEAFALALATEVDLAILDVRMPRLTGIQVAERLMRHRPATRVLVLSMHDDEQHFFDAIRAGASGYVLKSGTSKDLIAACRATMGGEPFVYPSALATLMRRYLDAETDVRRRDALTVREREVLKLIAEGFSANEIAIQLVISGKTVERHRSNILEKLELRNRVGLTRYAIRRGLVQP